MIFGRKTDPLEKNNSLLRNVYFTTNNNPLFIWHIDISIHLLKLFFNYLKQSWISEEIFSLDSYINVQPDYSRTGVENALL